MSTTQASTEALTHVGVGLTPEAVLRSYELMVLARALEQRWWQLNRQGKASIVCPCRGHEAAQLGCVAATDPARDTYFFYYRDMAAMLGLGVTPRELLLGFLAKQGEPFSSARQLPLHGAYPSKRIFNLSNVVAAQVPKAVGAALAFKMRREPAVAITLFGDGASSEGEWHEALNFAGVHRLPIVFFCENNRYAISVPQRLQMAILNVADRAAAYGFPGVTVDGTDLFAVYRATREAVERARTGGGPTLVEAKVERLAPHTSDDDDRRYRPPEELEEARRHDPLPRLRDYLLKQGLLAPEQDRGIEERAQREVDAATEEAERAPDVDPSALHGHVYRDALPEGQGGG